ncbi:MAG: ferrous iron transport protein B [Candidatus Hodarchaeales archaeon]
MHSHSSDETTKISSKKKIVLVGNPNVGKSVIFGSLTGKYATVSNYPGTTVEISTGTFQAGSSNEYLVIDTPGTNSLFPTSNDELVTKNVLIHEKPDIFIQVGDMKNLRRTLHLTLQLQAIVGSSPLIVVLNMMDEAKNRGIEINIDKLEFYLGIPVIATTATKNIGIDLLIETINESPPDSIRSAVLKTGFSPEIEEAIEKIDQILAPTLKENSRGLARIVLQGDSELFESFKNEISFDAVRKIDFIIKSLQEKFSSPLQLIITQELDREIVEISRTCTTKELIAKKRKSERLDDLLLNPITGTAAFIFTVLIIFFFVGMIGAGEIVDFFESVIFGEYINPFFIEIFELWIPIPIIQTLLVGDFGIITFGLTYAIAIVFPVVTTFFIAFSLLEDSGYLPRLAFLGDKLFRNVGLNGKAVLPLVLGTGCGTMATMTTRILETRKERLIATMAISLGIPCSAQLAVIFGILTFITPSGGLVVFGVVFSQLLLVTYFMSKVLPGEKSDFIMELPPLRIPNLKNTIVKTWGRVEWFLKEAVPLFVLGTIIISFFNLFTLLEIIQYSLAFFVIFVIWKELLSHKKEFFPISLTKYSTTAGIVVIIPATFIMLYLSGLPHLFSTNFGLIMPRIGFLFDHDFLYVLIEFSKPVIVTLLGLPPESAVMYILGFLRRDYGAAGFYSMATQGIINTNQIVVATIVLSLFVPCVASFFVINKEYGPKIAIGMIIFIIPFAILIGALVNTLLTISGVIL